jgi:hypothetical protein
MLAPHLMAPAALLGLALIACGATGRSTEAADNKRAISGKLEAFDFKRGAAFPARARVRIGDVTVAPGSNEVHVPVTLDRPTPNTIHARVMTRNGRWPAAGLEGRDYVRVDTVVIFRPGDPLTRTVRVPLKSIGAGREFELHFPEGVNGAGVADESGVIRAEPGAPVSRAQTEGFRAPRRFAPSGRPDWQLVPARARWSDGGDPAMFSTRLPHGRTQPGNGETGLYLDPAQHRAPQPPLAVEGGALVLRAQQLARPIKHEGRAWNHGAAVLTGQRMAATHVVYGQYEWEAQMPDRRGTWPALWLLPVSGWPPEIDVYEGFGNSSDWDFARDISANLHGGAGGKRRFTVPMRVDAQRVYGIGGFTEGYHRFAVDIAPDYVTWFVDGVEVYQAVNPFAGVAWFPLMTVAVKHDGALPHGNGAMRVRALRVWRAGREG